MIRGRISQVIEGVIKRFSAAGRSMETITSREYFQHYGYTSRPLAGSEGIIIREGNHIVMIASDDRRYRVSLDDGEVALYDDQGQKVHLKRNNEIHVVCLGKLTADVTNDVEINTARAAVNASESCIVTSPLVKAVATTQVILDTPITHCTGDLAVAGGISCSGTYGASGGRIQTPGDIESTAGEVLDQVRSMADDRALYNSHTHSDPQGGSVGTPTPQE
ncbi:MAG: phage baseplate assembly protein [Pseudomonadota bacterium]